MIADDFTYQNVEICGWSIASYIKESLINERGVVVCYDTRFGSKEFAIQISNIFLRGGIDTYLVTEPTPTPVITSEVISRGCDMGVIITASHNDWKWNGIKLRNSKGLSLDKEELNLIEKNFYDQAKLLKSNIDFFYLDVMGSGKECEIALKTIKSFNLPVLVGVHIRKNGKLPSGENISDIVKKYKEENWLGIIAACVHPESYEIITKELKNLDIPYGFKLNAFENIPDDYGVRSPAMWGKGGNPTKILGSREDITESKFYEFVKKFKDDGATILGGCCEIRPSHINKIAQLK